MRIKRRTVLNVYVSDDKKEYNLKSWQKKCKKQKELGLV
jgi:hypothetical protein